jgi:hypothetical protein
VWFGRDFASFGGVVPTTCDEEEWLTVVKPSQLGRVNAICGGAIVSHFSFFPQRQYLTKTDLLHEYTSVLRNQQLLDPSVDGVPKGGNMWTSRLMRGLRTIEKATEDQLRDVSFLADQIRALGLCYDERRLYGSDNKHMNAGPDGLYHIPEQLAKCLVCLSTFEIRTVLEVGTYSGWTISFITAYLLRFNKMLTAVTVDVRDRFAAYEHVKERLPLRFIEGDVSAVEHVSPFDLVIIDGDHSYEAARRDYDTVGKSAAICMFHDVNDKYVQLHDPTGGAPRLWREVQMSSDDGDALLTFCDHPAHEPIMGIGLQIRSRAPKAEVRLDCHPI